MGCAYETRLEESWRHHELNYMTWMHHVEDDMPRARKQADALDFVRLRETEASTRASDRMVHSRSAMIFITASSVH